MKDIVIVGHGGLAKEVAFLIEEINRAQPTWNLLGFIASRLDDTARPFGAYRICGTDEWLAETRDALGVIIGIGRPALVQDLHTTLQRNRRLSFPNLIHPRVLGITPQDVRDYFDQHPDEFRTEDRVQWQDIFVDSGKYGSREAALRAAQNLVAQARAGADFAELAKQYDNGDSNLRNGAGLGEKRGEVRPPALEAVVFALRQGDVADPVEIGTGFHVVRVARRTYVGIKPFDDELQRQIRNRLQNVIAEREYKRLVDDLKRRAVVQIAE